MPRSRPSPPDLRPRPSSRLGYGFPVEDDREARPPPASTPAYTARDTPEVVQRIGGDLALVLQVVARADPWLRALVLTGGFARGEGAVLRGEPQNDYDLVALRAAGPPLIPYARLQERLEARLGLHLDLQPVWVGRLGWVRPSIFWYETALRGRVLGGDASLLRLIPVRSVEDLAPTEGLRLLVNRAAGLLLAEPLPDVHAHRVQAAKGLLAALDAHLLARGVFAPSQRERWALYRDLADAGELAHLEPWREAFAWGFEFKVDPERAPARNAARAWREAGLAILEAVPVALAAAGLPSIQAYAEADSALDNLVYRLRAHRVPGARRWASHPTGRVRAATLAMLAERVGAPAQEAHGPARAQLEALLDALPPDGLASELLEKLRKATLQ